MWSHIKRILWAASSTLVPAVPLPFPELGGCGWSTVIFSWPYFKPCLYCSYSLNSASCALPACLLLLSPAWSEWQWLYPSLMSMFKQYELSAARFRCSSTSRPLSISPAMFANSPVTTTCHKASMHKAAGSLTAATQHHIYQEPKGWEPLPCIPA